MPASGEYVALAGMAAAVVARAVAHCVPVDDADLKAIDEIDPSSPEDQKRPFFERITCRGNAVTPGIWSFLLQGTGHRWQGPEQDFAVLLPSLRIVHPAAGNHAFNDVLDQGAQALACLGWILYGGDDQETHLGDAMEALYRLALTVKDAGNPSLAYDLAALALDVGPGFGAVCEQLAHFAIQLGLDAGKLDQVAMASAALAIAVAFDADTNPARQLEAFDFCETAVERIAGSPEPCRAMAASWLASALRQHAYLHTLLPPLVGFMAPDKQPAELREQLGNKPWPQRVSEVPWSEWQGELAARLTAQSWDGIADAARLALEQQDAADQVVADWTHWTVDHHAYRRAVPHMRSFLREAKFDEHFVVLTHEITHVLSMLGALGMASSALRAATLDAETTLWSAVPDIHGDAVLGRVSREGLAPLPPGDSGKLFRAEQSIELCLKGRILQDVWTPWFEGLAMFGELSAEPDMDPNGINVVTGSMRNLIDFTLAEDAPTDREARLAQYEQHIAEFEQRCSAAIKTVGPRRLRAYLERQDVPYLIGYLGIRATVATWRQGSARSISGTDAFNLLLHATRYSIGPYIPDLSLRSGLFEAAARTGMAEWAAALAHLAPGQIAAFLEPTERDGPGRSFRWTGMRLEPAEPGKGEQEFDSLLHARVSQALASLSRPEDAQRVAQADAVEAQFLEASAAALRGYLETDAGQGTVAGTVDLANMVLRLNSVLPIGRAQGKFFVNRFPGEDMAYMGIQARTTEAKASDGIPSVNAIWLPIKRSAADTIAAHYQQAGNPRMEVTRLIDLGGHVFSGAAYSSHFFAYKYGDWLDVYGTSPAVDSHLKADPEAYANALTLARARLYPNDMLRAECELIARGSPGAQRTRDWIDASFSWRYQEIEVGAPWARHVHQLAKQVLDPSTRRARQRHAGCLLLEGLRLDPVLIETVADSNFSTITEQIHHRDEIIDALLATARYPVAGDALASLAALTADAGFPVFSEGPQGWDVCPSKVIPPSSHGE